MTLLYDVSVRAVGKLKTKWIASVKAVPSDLVGHLHNGEHFKPDPQAVREALPYYWRKAFDRNAQRFWVVRCDGSSNQLQYECYAACLSGLNT
jgi:hypothetical protein